MRLKFASLERTGNFGIDLGIDVDALEIFTDKSLSGMGADILGQLFNNKVSHVWVPFMGEQYMQTKSLISI